jgi:hypothetical protein
MTIDLKHELDTLQINTETWQKVESPLGGQIYSVVLPGSNCIEAWKAVRAKLEGSHFYPILIGEPEDLQNITQNWDSWDINPSGEPKTPAQEEELKTADEQLHNYGRQGLEMLEESHGDLRKEILDGVSNKDLLKESMELLGLPAHLHDTLSQSIKTAEEDGSLAKMVDWQMNFQKEFWQLAAGPNPLLRLEAIKQLECPHGHPATTADIIEIGENLDVKLWLSERVKTDPRYYKFETGEWPDDSYKPEFSFGNTGLVMMLIVECLKPWHIPAAIRFGDANECPMAQVHVAILKQWNERYGAEPVAFGSSLELRINRPITTKKEALKVAREQSIYCGDLVHQGDGKLASVAARLLNADVWTFWWD